MVHPGYGIQIDILIFFEIFSKNFEGFFHNANLNFIFGHFGTVDSLYMGFKHPGTPT